MHIWTSSVVALLVAFQTMVLPSDAVIRVDIAHHSRRRTVRSTGAKGQKGATPEALLGLAPGEGLKAQSGSMEKTPKGTELVKLVETYKGVPVYGESVVVEVDSGGLPTGELRGRLITGIEDDLPSVVPRLDVEDVLREALLHTGDTMGSMKFNAEKDAHLQVYVTGTGNNMKARLTYKLSYRIENSRRISRPTFIIDANNGEVIKQWDAISAAHLHWFFGSRGLHRLVNDKRELLSEDKLVSGVGGNTKVGRRRYALNVTLLDSGKCALANDFVEAFNCDGSFDCKTYDMKPYEFNCQLGTHDHTNGAYSPLNDAFHNTEQTSKMFSDWFNVDDIFLQGEPVKVRVHYGEEFENAFWDGETVALGDGGSDLFPLTSLNMVAHEMAHGFTEMRSGLEPTGQAGAINEAFSDMTGEATEFFSKNATDWMISYDASKKPNESLRYFENPSKDGHSIGSYNEYCLGFEPHSASGIFNRAFYLLARTKNWNVRKAFHVFFTANSLYWHPDSQFHDAACDVVDAASDLGYEQDDVTNAFQEVGIEPCSTEGAGSLPGPVLIDENQTKTFEIDTHGIAVVKMVFTVESYDAPELSVDTGGTVFEIKAPNGYLPQTFTLPTVGGCLPAKPCIITLSSDYDSKISIHPMAHMKTIVTADTLKADQVLSKTFTMPQLLVESAGRVVISASTASSSGSLVYYIRHGRAPDVKSKAFDVMGTAGKDAVLCRPQSGKYYIKVLPISYTDEPVSDVNVSLLASFDAPMTSES